MRKIKASRFTQLQAERPDCPIHPYRIKWLSEYIETCTAIVGRTQRHWFRGQGSSAWSLTPSALRHPSESTRTRALESVDDFKRLVATKLDAPPQAHEQLLWIQIARHYGLPTRLLDWTQNAAIALYFACERVEEKSEQKDGLVFVFDPIELNLAAHKEPPRVFDANKDADLIRPYLELTGRRSPRGRPTIAIDPVWNSERLVLQKGEFTLHGAGNFALTQKQAPSLVGLAILHEDKEVLLNALHTIGIDEMSIFPEPEHVCSYIRHFLGL